jgi:hypothetical protein
MICTAVDAQVIHPTRFPPHAALSQSAIIYRPGAGFFLDQNALTLLSSLSFYSRRFFAGQFLPQQPPAGDKGRSTCPGED